MEYNYEDVKKEHPCNIEYEFNDVYEELLRIVSSEEDTLITDHLIKKHIDVLSPLHKEVIRYHSEGFDNKEIAEKTFLKLLTVEKIIVNFNRYIQYLCLKNKTV